MARLQMAFWASKSWRIAFKKRRNQAETIEHPLRDSQQIHHAQIGLTAAKSFGVGYEPFYAERIRSEMQHSLPKREFI